MSIELIPLKEVVKRLKSEFRFEEARKDLQVWILANLQPSNELHAQEMLWAKQQLALCTYKDDQLPARTKFAEALQILESIGLRDTERRNVETLSLGGAVYKRRFEFTGFLDDLFQAHSFYAKAWEHEPNKDRGYGGVNAAFVLDLLAHTAERRASVSRMLDADTFRKQSNALRSEVCKLLGKLEEDDSSLSQDYFFIATRAEAHFGLGEFAKAAEHLRRARARNPSNWELQTTALQLVQIARLQGRPADVNESSTLWRDALLALVGEDNLRGIVGCVPGKVGLALSGGGFRASFFHIGVLARLAEVDALRSVEVLSAVSGGSIVAAHYYLLLRELLQAKPDQRLERQDYIDLISKLSEQFFAGVSENLRMRVFAHVGYNLRMAFSWPVGKYRTVRLGKLYQSKLFSRIYGPDDTAQPRLMRDLLIRPAELQSDTGFSPKIDNWKRWAKIPALVLNATSLNTGHSWHFNAKGMGEPPALVGEEIDMKPRYRRSYYNDFENADKAQLHLRDVGLGQAVAASSCVPGLFAPIELKGFYHGRVVRLVDGGVHDNQGLHCLLAESCNFIIGSDASGQMGEVLNPNAREIGSLLRTNSALMERVREGGHQHFSGLADRFSLSGFCFTHLKHELDAQPLDWIGYKGAAAQPKTSAIAGYGIAHDLQADLAGVRTDLDAFTEVEAAALMISGYQMIEKQLKLPRTGAETAGFVIDAPRSKWGFLALGPLMGSPPSHASMHNTQRDDLALQLRAANSLFGRTKKLLPALSWGSAIIGSSILPMIAYLLYQNWGSVIDLPSISITWAALAKLVGWVAVVGIVAAFGLAAFAGFQILVLDRLLARRGSLKRLLGSNAPISLGLQ